MHAAKRRIVAVALLALVVAPALSGCMRVVEGELIVAASAPKASGGMTLFVAESPGLVDRARTGFQQAEYAIYHGEKLVYPAGGKGATFTIKDRAGSVFVPYNLFVVGNGDYDIVIRYDGDEYRARVGVQKWASYVYLHPYDMGSIVRVDVALQSATGGAPEARILAQGELLLEIVYRGLDGSEDRSLGTIRSATSHDTTSTRVDVPRSRLSAGPGYYSFEPLFHNGEAKNNVQVKADPTLANRDPPWNWIYITR